MTHADELVDEVLAILERSGAHAEAPCGARRYRERRSPTSTALPINSSA